MAIDCDKVATPIQQRLHLIISCVINVIGINILYICSKLVVSFAFLVYFLGWPALVGAAALIVLLPLNIVLMKMITIKRAKLLNFTDKRVRTMNEILQGIRVIKYFTWEKRYVLYIASTDMLAFYLISRLYETLNLYKYSGLYL
jgi:ABC-type multidrug transport system fused ATPase/permease subunit